MKIKILVLLLTTTLSACINIDKLFSTDYKEKTLNIPASINKIDFMDKRAAIDSNIWLPVVSKPKQLLEYHPEFNQKHEKLVSDLFFKNFDTNSSKSVNITVEIIEGLKQFSSTMWQETEKVKIELRILLTKGNEKCISECSGEYFVTSMDAKYKRFEELYQKALLNVTYKGLQELKTSCFIN